MTIKLPPSIQAYFDADNARSPDAVAAAFTDDAVVRDAGEVRVGRESIRRWKVETDQKYSYTLTEPLLITTENGKTQVTGHVSGDFPGSPVDLRYFFVLKGDKIAHLEITV
ncbi:nuclear transport factor 2 family protein [Aminobacter anthyllidis]|uniref:Nuclear transport factor 2 family protein n=1 Tax=Aminobacter anthyllidis TaxID=1035067 RepID=A0A9X1ACD2_9HYPH|nr:nuclear transport factor 2 family protein [Aminobacter anthyllidis]MBT1157169.1 nuclear transport factor 2 family protein [Aminobacter anthyllidis]